MASAAFERDDSGMITPRAATIGLMCLAVTGCTTTPNREIDPEAVWSRAERQHAATVAAVAQREQLQADYAAVIRLSQDGERRGQAYMRLAELDLALGAYPQARHRFEQSLRSGIGQSYRPVVLLMLGDVLYRHLNEAAGAATAYRQIIAEHPGTTEAELAALRLKELTDAR